MVRAEVSHRLRQGRPWRLALPLLALWAVFAGPAVAEIDYDSRRAAALRRCDEPQHRGRVEEARTCFRALLRDTNAVVRAEAAFVLRDMRTANDTFRAALAEDPRSIVARLRWGRLFIE